MPDKLHSRIKNRRLELGLSQDALAIACCVRQSTVANWELGGHIPRQGKIRKIAEALKLDEIWLISGEHPANEGAVNRYLNTPIRHVPVYSWPESQQSFETEKPIGYVTMTIAPENVFAVFAPENRTDFQHETMLMFTKDYNDSDSGVFLELSDSEVDLKTAERPTAQTAGRLIFSQTAH